MKNALRLAAVLAVLATAGCIDVSTVVKVRSDGTGQIVQTLFLSQALTGMMGMAQAMGDEQGAPPSLLDEDELRSKAQEMGEGVTYESGKEVVGENGAKGVRAVYAFADISKVNLNPMSGMDGMSGMGGGAINAEVEGADNNTITFEFEGGAEPTLTINIPQDKEDGDGAADAAAAPEPDVDAMAIDAEMPGGDAGQEMGKAMMRQMFGGMRVRFYVMVDGEITESNASYKEKGKKSGKEQFVALMDINLGELIKNPEKFEKLTAMGKPDDPAKMMEMLKDFPEMRIETQETVKVTFR
jgi:hypothetical protein